MKAEAVMRWIGERIQAVESLGPDKAEDQIIEIVVGMS